MLSNRYLAKMTAVLVATVCCLAVSHEINYPSPPPGDPLPHPNACGVPTMGDVLRICEIEPWPDGSTVLIFEKRFTNCYPLLEAEYDGQLVGVDAWWDLDDIGDMTKVVSFPLTGRVPLMKGEAFGMGIGSTYGLVAFRFVGKLIDLDDMVYWIDSGAQ